MLLLSPAGELASAPGAAATLRSAAAAPGQAASPHVQGSSAEGVVLAWEAAPEHGSAVSGYTLQRRPAGQPDAEWSVVEGAQDPPGCSRAVACGARAEALQFRVVAHSPLGDGPPSRSPFPSTGILG